MISFFFFQAEDGIRDHCVTGVQTCALPISCGQHVPLSAAQTCRGCDSRASNEPPFAGQRGVVEQSRPDAVHAPTSESLESVVSLRLQNREVLQQGFPCPIRRRISEKDSLYYARLNKSLLRLR